MKPKAAGCLVTWADLDIILQSIACFAAFVGYGACLGALGAALPEIAQQSGVSETSLGILFTGRGVGYLVGTLLSGVIMEKLRVNKPLVVALAMLCAGIGTGILAGVTELGWMIFLVFLQGLGYGGVDTVSNVVLAEVWLQRVTPWMQALHSFFGLGAVIGPAMVGAMGYKASFLALVALCVVPALFLLVQYIHDKFYHNSRNTSDGNDATSFESLDEEDTNKPSSPPSAAIFVPIPLRVLLSFFLFIYVGMEAGFGGWISSYGMLTGITSNHGDAAFLSAIFFAALSIGRVLAIPAAVFIPTTSMLRFQLLVSGVGAVLTVIIAPMSYQSACIASAVLGFGASSLFPLIMTVVGDYGLTMDASATTLLVVGSTCGEAVIPVCMGLAMSAFGPAALPLSVLSTVVFMFATYTVSHIILRRDMLARHKKVEEEESGVEMTEGDKHRDVYSPLQNQTADVVIDREDDTSDAV